MISQIDIGKTKIHLKEIDSTSSYLKRVIANSEPINEGTVIMADNQYQGRGQQGNSWISEVGKNLTMSFFINCNLNLTNCFILNKVFSLGIHTYLYKKLNIVPYIKWPNDFICNNKKICGLLIENIINSNKIQKSIIGIGLNVNQENFSKEAGKIGATSMKLINGFSYNIENVADELCININKEYKNFCKNIECREYISDLNLRYINNLYGLNTKNKFLDLSKNKKLYAIVTGVTDLGELILKTDEGHKYFKFKSIRFLSQNFCLPPNS